jgi:hypothetical protein
MMKFLLSIIRTVLGWLIQVLDWITRPKPVERTEEEQQFVDAQLEHMTLYEFEG